MPILSSASERAWMLPVAHAGKAAVAAATAASTWLTSPCVYSAIVSPRFDGFRVQAVGIALGPLAADEVVVLLHVCLSLV